MSVDRTPPAPARRESAPLEPVVLPWPRPPAAWTAFVRKSEPHVLTTLVYKVGSFFMSKLCVNPGP